MKNQKQGSMTEKQYFPREVKGSFNLRKPKGAKPSPIYFVVRICGKQFKIPLGVKVYPSQWSKSRQEAYISANISESDNRNNHIVNAIIARIKLAFTFVMEDNYHIVIDNLNSEGNVNTIIKMLKSNIGGLGKSGKKTIEKDIFDVLHRAIDKDTVKESTKNAYRDVVNRFERFCKGEGIVLEHFDDLNKEILGRYQVYLRGITDQKRTVDGRLSVAHINKLINALLQRLNNYGVKEELMSANVFESLKHLKPIKEYVKEGDNTIALHDDEVYRLFHHKCSNPMDEDIKNLFCFSCCVGQRISDWEKVADSIQTVDGITVFRIKQAKCGSVVRVALVFELAQQILDLYDGRLPKVDENKVNARIKKIAKAANVGCEETIIYRQSGMKQEVVEKKVHRYDLITSHTSRRTFITMLALRGKTHRYIMEHSGHKDFRMVDRYTKTTAEDITLFEKLKSEHPEMVLKLIDYEKKSASKVANVGKALKGVGCALCALFTCLFS